MRLRGFEPPTLGFEDRCSNPDELQSQKKGSRETARFRGAWWGSNPRQPDPQSGALPLNYRHHIFQISVFMGISEKSSSMLFFRDTSEFQSVDIARIKTSRFQSYL